MKFYFLGTGSSYPTPTRGVSSLALQFETGSVWLFDCGEGTQIQIQKVHVSRRRINKIFITHLHGDHLFGLPGLLCTVSSQLELTPEDLQTGKHPVIEIYGPLGLRKYINVALSLSRSALSMKFKVHELLPVEEQYPADWNEWVVDHSSSSALHPSEEPGSIIQPVRKEGHVVWKIFEDKLHSVEAGMIHHRIPSFGFLIKEKDRVGTLLVDKLKQLGVTPGPFYGKLKSGIPITLSDGQVVKPEDVLGPPLKGRTVVVCGDTSDASPMIPLVGKCDVLVHEATYDDSFFDKAKEFGHSTSSRAADICRRLQAKVLLLNHFSQRYSNSSKDESKENTIDMLLDEARNCLRGTETEVHCTHDLFVYSLGIVKRDDS